MLPSKGTQESEEFHQALEKSLDMEGELLSCPDCGRLLWRKPGDEVFEFYVKE